MKKMHWASIWGNAVSIGENRPESYGKNITLRYPIYSAFDGDALRLTFDNYCGTDADLRLRLSTEKRVNENTCPAFIWHTFEDNCVPVENSISSPVFG